MDIDLFQTLPIPPTVQESFSSKKMMKLSQVIQITSKRVGREVALVPKVPDILIDQLFHGIATSPSQVILAQANSLKNLPH